jgi:hypothetical protein
VAAHKNSTQKTICSVYRVTAIGVVCLTVLALKFAALFASGQDNADGRNPLKEV